MKLKGQVAIVTGASSGIGEAIAENLSEAGMQLVLSARRQDRLAEVCRRLGKSTFLAGNLTSSELPRLLLDKAISTFGRCDVVVNNAGMLEVGSIGEIDLERACRMVRVNVESAYRVAYTAARFFLEQNSGFLVNLSSVLGTKTRPTAGAYAGTKHAIEALSEALRLELSCSGIRVCAVEPGLVLTELHDHMQEHPREALKIGQPLLPEDVARCVRFVLQQPEHVLISRLMVLPRESPV
jgi:NADP-dependent 3-hydroxy acid dehydrogenase YdfG